MFLLYYYITGSSLTQRLASSAVVSIPIVRMIALAFSNPSRSMMFLAILSRYGLGHCCPILYFPWVSLGITLIMATSCTEGILESRVSYLPSLWYFSMSALSAIAFSSLSCTISALPFITTLMYSVSAWEASVG